MDIVNRAQSRLVWFRELVIVRNIASKRAGRYPRITNHLPHELSVQGAAASLIPAVYGSRFLINVNDRATKLCSP
jgi:hypothetical protein